MMIRINLLPTGQVKKRSQGSQMLGLIAGTLALALAGNYYWYSDRESASAELTRKITSLQQQIEEKKRVIKEVETIRTRREEVKKRLDVLKALRDGRTGPVRMLDALASATPKNVWLTSFNQGKGNLTLFGSAATNDDVAELMRSLAAVVWTPKGLGRIVDQRAGATTSRVELLSAEMGNVEEFPVSDIKSFFTGIDLKETKARTKDPSSSSERVVDFQLVMATSYAT